MLTDGDHRASTVMFSGYKKGQPLVFLDRDFTICYENPLDKALDEVELIPGSGEAIRILKEGGYFLVAVSNQPRIVRREISEVRLAEVNKTLNQRIWGQWGVKIDAFLYCPHEDDDCPWRKPNPGMLMFVAARLDIDLTQTTIVGDSHKDVLAGQAVGARTIQVATSNTVSFDPVVECDPDYATPDLLEAARLIVHQDRV